MRSEESELTDSGGLERNAAKIDERNVPLKLELGDSYKKHAGRSENADYSFV
jgi:hypothetical protein